jgi:dTDP-4-dehydrorhamnose reductase
MKILILGGDGMLGHQLMRGLSPRHDVTATLRRGRHQYTDLAQALDLQSCLFDIDVCDTNRLHSAIDKAEPDVILNAVGIVKQRVDSKDALLSIGINALLPHQLAVWCAERGSRLVHFSTDCVFDGRQGMYVDDDFANADDLYGRTKVLGEVGAPAALTLRTSIIGLELSRKSSLVEWFLAQSGVIRGFTRAIYSGFTTQEMTRIVDHVVSRHPGRNGIYQVSSEPISKYELLSQINMRIGSPVRIDPDSDFHCDRSLDSTRFRRDFGYDPPSWDVMIDELCEQIIRRRR